MYINLLLVVDYLHQHHDVMFVLPGQNGALVYDPVTDEVVTIWGDFSGTPEEQREELSLGLQKHHAWIN